MTKIVLSSGHGLYVRGASGLIDEVDEARKVVEATARRFKDLGVDVTTYHDDVSTTQSENLERIVDFHNAQGPHDLDISVHFNAYTETESPMGTEVLYISQNELADDLSATIAAVSGLIVTKTSPPITRFIQARSGILLNVMPGQRILKIVATKFTPPEMLPTPPSRIERFQ